MQYTLRQLIDSATVTDITVVGSAMDFIPPAETVRMATIVIATVPILCVYPFLQKYFVRVCWWARSRAEHAAQFHCYPGRVALKIDVRRISS